MTTPSPASRRAAKSLPQQRQDGQSGQVAVGDPRPIAAEHGPQCLGLRTGERVDVLPERPQQLQEPGAGEIRLGLHTRDPQDPRGRQGGGVVEQRGLAEPALPLRPGTAPQVIGPAPHGQRSQIPSVMLQEELWQRMRALPHLYMAPTLVSVSHARSLFLPEGIGSGPAEAFQKDREWAHIHPHHDGSLHLTLPESFKDDVEAAGWGVRHPQHHRYALGDPR